jgi:hypothetical protein
MLLVIEQFGGSGWIFTAGHLCIPFTTKSASIAKIIVPIL